VAEDPWESRLALCRARLAPALALTGEWVGQGLAHGEPITARLRVRPILGDTVVEVWEKVGAHEDLSLYRFEPDTGQLEVLHLMEGRLEQHPVELTPDGMVWVSLPGQPAVVFSLVGDTVVSEVVWSGQRVPEVRIVYRRA
jgi:hypothetical protein